MKHYLLLPIVLFAFLAGGQGVRAVAKDPFAGTWSMVPEKSTYPSGTLPRTMAIEMSPLQDGVRYYSKTTYANGASSIAQYTAKYDGRESVVQGAKGLMLPVSLERLSPSVVIATYKRGMIPFAASRREVSLDGKQMTITTVSTDKDGRKTTTIGVYEKKQDSAPNAVVSIF